MKFILVLVCLVALWNLAVAQVARVYCGRRLARTLATLCPELEEEGVMKRAGDDTGPYGAHQWRWALRGARGKRGVADECCEKPCTLDILLSYC
ncbi:bombyxin-related peptide B-like [Manduca sexta]|uniref:bombyxin-related peptide B-like n=1 Tax=Manduca sexta TaxID=7130 RepID=UPI00188EF049|nr:bombyxin-related peptide B-like [Manduca sexta]